MPSSCSDFHCISIPGRELKANSGRTAISGCDSQSVSHGCCSSPPSLFQSISQTYYPPAFSFQTLSIFVSIFLYHFTHTPMYFISPVFPSSCGRLALFLQTGCTQFGEARMENPALQTRRLYICYRLAHLKTNLPSRFGGGNSTQNT